MADSKKYNGSTWQHSLRKLTTATDTLTTLPADIYADGTNATVGLEGNMSQTGTPTPSSPIQPQECGERTGNLVDYNYLFSNDYDRQSEYFSYYKIEATPNTTYTASSNAPYTETGVQTTFMIGTTDTQSTANNGIFGQKTITTDSTGILYIAIRIKNGAEIAAADINDYISGTYYIMLNSGSTPLPCEPYGYKIPISSASTTTPVYLGEVQTTRKIGKLVLTGNETFFRDKERADSWRFYSDALVSGKYNVSICSHFAYIGTSGVNDTDDIGFSLFSASQFGCRCPKSVANTVNEFKAWLATQYAAGTPVTVWYVLATEETAVVNEPLRKIGDYADTVSGITIPTITGADSFDVLTTLKPSEVSLSYTGWHDASVKEWDGNQWQ